eukprot:4662519-Pleurochrysis_carterae.AAC.1
MSLGASAPPPLSFSSAAARAMPANTLHLPRVQAVASCRRNSVLHLPSTKAAGPPRGASPRSFCRAPQPSH